MLVASGAFKDLYSPIEACEVIAGALGNDIQKEIVCFCDGGEYTYDILKDWKAIEKLRLIVY